MPDTKTQELLDSVTASIKKLAEATDATAKSEQFRAWLRMTGKFHKYSWSNQMLIWCQRSDAENVAGYQTWKSLGRHVKKGAKGIPILAPIVRKIKDNDDDAEKKPALQSMRAVGFRTVFVFDIADTEGESLPELGPHRATSGGEAVLLKLEAAARSLGITVRYEAIGNGANGCSSGGVVLVEESLTPTERAGTLAHELAHECLHQGAHKQQAPKKSKEQRELEAEATSFAVLDHFGIEQPSSIYLAAWSADAESLTASLATIRNAVATILDAAEKAAQTEQPEYALAA